MIWSIWSINLFLLTRLTLLCLCRHVLWIYVFVYLRCHLPICWSCLHLLYIYLQFYFAIAAKILNACNARIKGLANRVLVQILDSNRCWNHSHKIKLIGASILYMLNLSMCASDPVHWSIATTVCHSAAPPSVASQRFKRPHFLVPKCMDTTANSLLPSDWCFGSAAQLTGESNLS